MKNSIYRSLACLFFLLWGTGLLRADNWPTWRGQHGNGISDEQDLPVNWGATKNVRWKVALPEPGNSTPIVWGDRVFLTQALDKGKRRAVIAFARADGKKLWQREIPCSVSETSHDDNPPASASPVTDGEAVYAHFASAGVVAYDFNGKPLWHRDLGPVLHVFGNGASPALHRNLLYVFHGPGEPTFLTALDKRTGKTVWHKNETAMDHKLFGTWSSPIVARLGGRDEVLLALPGDQIGGDGWVKSYEPETGEELWRCVGLGASLYPSPVVSAEGDVIVGVSGFMGPALAVRPGGRGDVTGTHRLWHVAGNPQRIGSPVVTGGHVYQADADGFTECLDARTGKQIWKERLGGKLWGSMLLAGGKLYVGNLEGKTFVLSARPRFQLHATNDVAEPTYAALAPSNGELFLRTWKHLYCIAKSNN